MFFMGLFLGLAVSSTVALGTLLHMAWSGKSLGLGTAPAIAAAPTQPSAPTPTPTQPAAPVKPVDEKVDHIIGNKNAKITMIEYSDFQCPFCQRHEATMKQALKDFPKDVRLVYRHFPLSFHPNAMPAAIASECVAKLGGNDKFWNFHDQLFANQDKLSSDLYLSLAKQLGVNENDFKSCLTDPAIAARVNQDEAEGGSAGVEGTPATFINGKNLDGGAIPYDQGFKAALIAAGAKE
jgi:protein-disulfide isomerase